MGAKDILVVVKAVVSESADVVVAVIVVATASYPVRTHANKAYNDAFGRGV
jgi:hypothetical protein